MSQTRVKSGFATSEFWAALAGVAGKVVVLLIALNVISSENPENLVRTVTELVISLGALWGITKGVTSYGAKRTELKRAALANAYSGPVRWCPNCGHDISGGSGP